jgi:hypothetical protein
MFRKFPEFRILALIAALSFTACDSDSTGVETGRLSVLLTDAPGDFHTAMVTISGIYLQGEEGEDAARVWLMEDEVTTDLLTLANDAIELVDGVEIPAGNYAQLRFVISGGYVEVEQEDGSTLIYASSGYEHLPVDRTADGPLQMPSFAQSGVKVILPGGGVQVGRTQTVLLVDFNVAESFGQQAGASGMWVMNPVIHAADFELSSSVTVTLALGDDVELPGDATLADFTAHLSDESDNAKEADFVADAETGVHTATFSWLMPGELWELSIEGPDGVTFETDVEFPLEIETGSGSDVEVDVTVTAAEAS